MSAIPSDLLVGQNCSGLAKIQNTISNGTCNRLWLIHTDFIAYSHLLVCNLGVNRNALMSQQQGFRLGIVIRALLAGGIAVASKAGAAVKGGGALKLGAAAIASGGTAAVLGQDGFVQRPRIPTKA